MNDKAIEKAAFNLAVDIQELYGLEIGVVPDIEKKVYEQDVQDSAPEGLMKALQLILPLAKGYANEHNVGSNQKYIEIAEQAIHAAQERKEKDRP